VALCYVFGNKGEGMVWKAVRNVVAAGVLAAVAACTVRAADDAKAPVKDDAPQAPPAVAPGAPPAGVMPAPGPDGCGSGCASECAAPAPAFRTVCVTEWRPEQYQSTRTAYRTEYTQETYTAYRCEYSCETRTRTVTVNRMVPEVQQVTRTVCVNVPTVEERTVMKTHVSYRPVTTMVSKCEDHGHWECREVECGPSLHDRLKKCLHHKNDCCEECEKPRTKTVREWVPCKVMVQVPVTRCERVCEQVPVTCRVTVCRK
jgi:hypothetical protein